MRTSDEDKLTVSTPPAIAPHYGAGEDIANLAKRIQIMMPGGDKLTTSQAMAAASAAVLSDANLFRGEVYAYPDVKGNLVLVDGYKLLVREAKRQCDYTVYDDIALTQEEKIAQGLKPEDIAFWVYLLRDDKKGLYTQELREAKEFGLGYREAKLEALNFAAAKAVGYIKKTETWSKRYKREIDPPKNMTWPDKAKMRGLKKALRMAYALPSPREIAARSWDVDGTQTTAEDWQGVELYTSEAEQEQAAKRNAWGRERIEESAALTEDEKRGRMKRNVELMRDPVDFDPIAEEEVIEGEVMDIDPATRFWSYQRQNDIDPEVARALIAQAGGDIDSAFEMLQAQETPPKLEQPPLIDVPADDQTVNALTEG